MYTSMGISDSNCNLSFQVRVGGAAMIFPTKNEGNSAAQSNSRTSDDCEENLARGVYISIGGASSSIKDFPCTYVSTHSEWTALNIH